MIEKNKYISKFFSMKCATDVMIASGPNNRFLKEITESLSLLELCKDLISSRPNEISLIDLCAGKALTSIFAVHTMKIKNAFAIDKIPPSIPFEAQKTKVRKFHYMKENIFTILNNETVRNNLRSIPTILLSSHPCRRLTECCLEISKIIRPLKTIIMPCCIDVRFRKQYKKDNNIPNNIGYNNDFEIYIKWIDYLADKYKYEIIVDDQCLSQRNHILVRNN